IPDLTSQLKEVNSKLEELRERRASYGILRKPSIGGSTSELQSEQSDLDELKVVKLRSRKRRNSKDGLCSHNNSAAGKQAHGHQAAGQSTRGNSVEERRHSLTGADKSIGDFNEERNVTARSKYIQKKSRENSLEVETDKHPRREKSPQRTIHVNEDNRESFLEMCKNRYSKSMLDLSDGELLEKAISGESADDTIPFDKRQEALNCLKQNKKLSSDDKPQQDHSHDKNITRTIHISTKDRENFLEMCKNKYSKSMLEISSGPDKSPFSDESSPEDVANIPFDKRQCIADTVSTIGITKPKHQNINRTVHISSNDRESFLEKCKQSYSKSMLDISGKQPLLDSTDSKTTNKVPSDEKIGTDSEEKNTSNEEEQPEVKRRASRTIHISDKDRANFLELCKASYSKSMLDISPDKQMSAKDDPKDADESLISDREISSPGPEKDGYDIQDTYKDDLSEGRNPFDTSDRSKGVDSDSDNCMDIDPLAGSIQDIEYTSSTDEERDKEYMNEKANVDNNCAAEDESIARGVCGQAVRFSKVESVEEAPKLKSILRRTTSMATLKNLDDIIESQSDAPAPLSKYKKAMSMYSLDQKGVTNAPVKIPKHLPGKATPFPSTLTLAKYDSEDDDEEDDEGSIIINHCEESSDGYEYIENPMNKENLSSNSSYMGEEDDMYSLDGVNWFPKNKKLNEEKHVDGDLSEQLTHKLSLLVANEDNKKSNSSRNILSLRIGNKDGDNKNSIHLPTPNIHPDNFNLMQAKHVNTVDMDELQGKMLECRTTSRDHSSDEIEQPEYLDLLPESPIVPVTEMCLGDLLVDKKQFLYDNQYEDIDVGTVDRSNVPANDSHVSPVYKTTVVPADHHAVTCPSVTRRKSGSLDNLNPLLDDEYVPTPEEFKRSVFELKSQLDGFKQTEEDTECLQPDVGDEEPDDSITPNESNVDKRGSLGSTSRASSQHSIYEIDENEDDGEYDYVYQGQDDETGHHVYLSLGRGAPEGEFIFLDDCEMQEVCENVERGMPIDLQRYKEKPNTDGEDESLTDGDNELNTNGEDKPKPVDYDKSIAVNLSWSSPYFDENQICDDGPNSHGSRLSLRNDPLDILQEEDECMSSSEMDRQMESKDSFSQQLKAPEELTTNTCKKITPSREENLDKGAKISRNDLNINDRVETIGDNKIDVLKDVEIKICCEDESINIEECDIEELVHANMVSIDDFCKQHQHEQIETDTDNTSSDDNDYETLHAFTSKKSDIEDYDNFDMYQPVSPTKVTLTPYGNNENYEPQYVDLEFHTNTVSIEQSEQHSEIVDDDIAGSINPIDEFENSANEYINLLSYQEEDPGDLIMDWDYDFEGADDNTVALQTDLDSGYVGEAIEHYKACLLNHDSNDLSCESIHVQSDFIPLVDKSAQTNGKQTSILSPHRNRSPVDSFAKNNERDVETNCVHLGSKVDDSLQGVIQSLEKLCQNMSVSTDDTDDEKEAPMVRPNRLRSLSNSSRTSRRSSSNSTKNQDNSHRILADILKYMKKRLDEEAIKSAVSEHVVESDGASTESNWPHDSEATSIDEGGEEDGLFSFDELTIPETAGLAHSCMNLGSVIMHSKKNNSSVGGKPKKPRPVKPVVISGKPVERNKVETLKFNQKFEDLRDHHPEEGQGIVSGADMRACEMEDNAHVDIRDHNPEAATTVTASFSITKHHKDTTPNRTTVPGSKVGRQRTLTAYPEGVLEEKGPLGKALNDSLVEVHKISRALSQDCVHNVEQPVIT
ncbi:unnamed protein product, partial [Owenia fusiformis]